MTVQPNTENDTVVYTLRNFHADKDLALVLLDGSTLYITGQVFLNGDPLGAGGSFPIASQAEAEAGADNSKAMTPLRTTQHLTANWLSNFANNTATNARLADMAQNTIKGRVTASTGDPEDLTPAQARTIITSDSGGGTTNFLRADGTFAAPVAVIADGDKGDITISGTGTVFTIDSDVVTNAKLSSIATNRFKGRVSASTGVVEDLTPANARTVLVSDSGGGTTNYLRADGSFAQPPGTFALSNDTVTNAILANVATATFKGRTTAGTGDPEDLTVAQALALITSTSGGGTSNFLRADGTWNAPTASVADGDKGDITVSSSGTVWTVDDDTISNAKLANVATATFKGRTTAATGDPEDLTVAQALALMCSTSGGGTTNFLRADGTWAAPPGGGGVSDGDKGDITVSSSGTVWTIDANAVGNSKLAQVATATIKGRVSASTGDVEDLTAANVKTILGTLTVPDGGTGVTSFGSFRVVLTGTTGTGALRNMIAGTAGHVLASGGTGSDPSWVDLSTVYQPLDSDLTTIAGLTATTDNFIVSVSSNWASRTPAQVKTTLAITESDVANLVTDLANKQPLDSDLTTIAALTATTDNVIQSVAGAWSSRTPAQLKSTLALAKADVGLGNVDNTSDATKNSTTATLTNKRVTPRVGSTTSSATPTINTDNVDQFNITALATNITSMTTNLSGTPTAGQRLLIRITGDATPRTITWGASFVSSGIATLLATTAASKTHLVGLMWDAVISKWVCHAVDATGY